MELRIQHCKTEDGTSAFKAVRVSDGKTGGDVCLTPPSGVKGGDGGRTLAAELRWYLEEYLTLPINQYQDRANETWSALIAWGQECFNALFDSGDARDWLRDAQNEGLENLTLAIISDDPSVLAWPWEALYAEKDGFLAQRCRLERRIDAPDIYKNRAALPQDKLNILYVLPRHEDDPGVGFQTLARPLLDYIADKGWPVRVDVLRPATFDNLRETLQEKENFYHIVHFDGHGGAPKGGKSGILLFEKGNDPDQEGDPVPAEKLSKLLRDCNVPYVVLNACQSAAMADGSKENRADPFAAVAAALLKSGADGVVAMTHSLLVTGAKVFVPAFYKRLFEKGDVSEAMRGARQEMAIHNERAAFPQTVELNDWILPVLYHRAGGKRILPRLKRGKSRPSYDKAFNRKDFVGRDTEILRLERAFRQDQAAILIHGMAGEGKTTLANAFLQWLIDTGGLDCKPLWIDFRGVQSAESVFERLLGDQWQGGDLSAIAETVAEQLRDTPLVMVWDNFESATGHGGVKGLLSQAHLNVLKDFLTRLRYGKTKVLITSRSSERRINEDDKTDFLDSRVCFRVPLEGLKGMELWDYVRFVIADLGLRIKPGDEDYKPLLDKLDGNPLAIRAILLRLEDRAVSPRSLLKELERGIIKGKDGDDATNRLVNALAVFSEGLKPEYNAALRLIGLHEHYVDVDYIKGMLENMGEPTEHLTACMNDLERAGMCRPWGGGVYALHPAVPAALRNKRPAGDAEKRAFVDFMGTLCDHIAPKELHEQRGVFELIGASFQHALTLAEGLDMREHILALTQGLGVYAQNTRRFDEAERWYRLRIGYAEKFDRPEEQAAAYHQLGTVAQERRDFDAAEGFYRESLKISLKLGDEHGAATTYHQLGMVAQERRDFDAAGGFYRDSLTTWLKLGDEHGAASTYHQLGSVAQERRDFDAAERFYRDSLKIKLKLGDEYGAAITYGQLGRLAEDRGDLTTAEQLANQTLALFIKHNDPHNAAIAERALTRIRAAQAEKGDQPHEPANALAAHHPQPRLGGLLRRLAARLARRGGAAGGRRQRGGGVSPRPPGNGRPI